MTTTATETNSLVLLRHHLKLLRLPTIGAECEKVARQCATDNSDHLNYLLQLAELELLERERRAAERRLKAARFPTMKSLDTFDYAARPSVNEDRAHQGGDHRLGGLGDLGLQVPMLLCQAAASGCWLGG